MATKTIQRYDHPNFTLRRETSGMAGGATASIVSNAFLAYQKHKLKAIHAKALVRGTATTYTLVLQKDGTGSLGLLLMGTSAIGTAITLLVGSAVAANTAWSLLQGVDITGRSVISWEWEVEPGAAVTDN
jgi:hypothetical protein